MCALIGAMVTGFNAINVLFVRHVIPFVRGPTIGPPHALRNRDNTHSGATRCNALAFYQALRTLRPFATPALLESEIILFARVKLEDSKPVPGRHL
jgi:hypothetical protein